MWKKAMDYLGLGPDDAYDDYDDALEPEPERPVRQSRAPREEPRYQGGYANEYDEAPPRPSSGRPSFPSHVSASPDVVVRRPMPAGDRSSVQPRPSNPRIIPITKSSSGAGGSGDPYTVKPKRFDSAQELADKFKEGLPVIMNLEAADREVSRRLIDFASGLCYGLNGSMEKVASGVYLLKPLQHPTGYDDGGYGA